VGRRALLADIRERLASSRVVTLVGPGGVGKTRIALRIAEEAPRTYREGCWVVPLADLTKPELLSATVAEALDLQGTEGPIQVETLADQIADRTALLVLDNCEHLLAAVGALVQELRGTCPNVRFLLTSRRPLRLNGEDLILVPPLSLPDQETVATPEAITHYEAVNLFVDRARSASSEFELTPDNAAAVLALCRDLEGLPLAIELAAARIRSLSPQEIGESLTDRLKVLTVGYRDAAERHQSLRACVEWSYDLCSHPEQRLWARASVFTGGCDLEAARAVCGADDLPADEVLDLMSALVDQSVVITEEATPGHTRYRMLVDIRQFGLERAEKDGELHGLMERHASWYSGLVSRFDAEARGPNQAGWLLRLHPESANLRAAMEYAAGGADGAADGLVMARKLDLYWSASGSLDEARHWLEIELAAGPGEPQERARALALAARFAILQGDRLRARELVAEGNELAAAVDDTRAEGLLLVPAAMLSLWDGSPAAAAEQADRAVELLSAESELAGDLLALFVAGICHGFAGNGVEATARHQQCIARAEEVGERHMKALAVAGLGEEELSGGHLAEATALFREAIVLKRELSDRMGIAVGLNALGRVATAEGRGERAALLLGAAKGIWALVGMSETGNPFALIPPRSDGLQQARTLLGKERFRELFRRGSRLSLDEAVRWALEEKVDSAAPIAPVEPSPLTRRELEVADLVADGLSNPEIAARLVISVRTAQGHVENILRKLGFNSRSLIAAWVTERRLAEEHAPHGR
jgi:predicted ATPase/DNA-binding CsgD family transcriptional regulator